MTIYGIIYLVVGIFVSIWLIWSLLTDRDFVNEKWYTKTIIISLCVIIPHFLITILGVIDLNDYMNYYDTKDVVVSGT